MAVKQLTMVNHVSFSAVRSVVHVPQSTGFQIGTTLGIGRLGQGRTGDHEQRAKGTRWSWHALFLGICACYCLFRPLPGNGLCLLASILRRRAISAASKPDRSRDHRTSTGGFQQRGRCGPLMSSIAD